MATSRTEPRRPPSPAGIPLFVSRTLWTASGLNTDTPPKRWAALYTVAPSRSTRVWSGEPPWTWRPTEPSAPIATPGRSWVTFMRSGSPSRAGTRWISRAVKRTVPAGSGSRAATTSTTPSPSGSGRNENVGASPERGSGTERASYPTNRTTRAVSDGEGWTETYPNALATAPTPLGLAWTVAPASRSPVPASSTNPSTTCAEAGRTTATATSRPTSPPALTAAPPRSRTRAVLRRTAGSRPRGPESSARGRAIHCEGIGICRWSRRPRRSMALGRGVERVVVWEGMGGGRPG